MYKQTSRIFTAVIWKYFIINSFILFFQINLFQLFDGLGSITQHVLHLVLYLWKTFSNHYCKYFPFFPDRFLQSSQIMTLNPTLMLYRRHKNAHSDMHQKLYFWYFLMFSKVSIKARVSVGVITDGLNTFCLFKFVANWVCITLLNPSLIFGWSVKGFGLNTEPQR